MYRVLDNENKLVANFETYSDANHFRHLKGRPDWSIKRTPKQFRGSTDRQKFAVRYCEDWLNIKFIGDIDNFASCSEFLREHLDLAKATETQYRKQVAEQEKLRQEAINQFYLKTDAIGDYDDAMG